MTKPISFFSEDAYHLKGLIRLLEDELWHWKRFPIVLPDPVVQTHPVGTMGGNNRKRTLKVGDLFVRPDFNETAEIALDIHGNKKRLNIRQLEAIRNTGEFEVI